MTAWTDGRTNTGRRRDGRTEDDDENGTDDGWKEWKKWKGQMTTTTVEGDGRAEDEIAYTSDPRFEV